MFVLARRSGNIFAVEPRKIYLSSPTRDAEARSGLGGAQGLGIAAGAVGIVALATLQLSKSSSFEGESLSYFLALFTQ